VNAAAWYAADYAQARQKFLWAAESAAARVEHWHHPFAVGPGGEPLFTDSAFVGDDDADVLVLSLSAMHGDEGLCGSALQVAWFAQQGARLPRGVALLAVHALNPFGFAHGVRVNENGVDLNRNWIDHGARPPNPLYEAFHATLPPPAPPTAALRAQWQAAYERFYAEHGDWAASDAISRGQYTRADGLQYGGDAPQWSSRVLLELLGRHAPRARHVVYLDWHSLVRSGDGQLVFLCFNQTGDALFTRAASWWGDAAVNRQLVNAQWAQGIERSERRPTRCGLQMWGVQRALAPRADVAGAVIEFCADPDPAHEGLQAEIEGTLVQRWLLAAAQSGQAGSAEAAALRQQRLQAGCPPRPAFRERTLAAALEAHAAAVEGAGRWARDDVPAAPGLLRTQGAFE
jgi:hypothetical protein